MIERVDVLGAFDREHHGEHGPVQWDEMLLFEDGARRSLVAYGPLGQTLTEPCPREDERREWIKRFWEVRLENLVETFETVKVAATNNVQSNPAGFARRVEQLKSLQSQIRQARSKLAHLTTQERGFTQADVSKAWDCWNAFAAASREESEASAKFQNAFLGKSSPGVLEKLKLRFDQAREKSARAMARWNDFTPVEARCVVAEQLDASHAAERYAELEQIEI